MKIGLLVTNLKGGGAEKAILKLAQGLLARSHDVRVIILERKIEYITNIKPHVVNEDGIGKGYFGKRKTARKLRLLYDFLSREQEFDLIISTLPYADEIAHLAKIPNIWHRIADSLSAELQELEKTNRNKAKRRLKRYRRLYSNKNLIAVSHGVKDDMTNQLNIEANIQVIHNIYPRETIERLSNAPHSFAEPYIIHAGRFSPQKRHDILFEAFKLADTSYKLVLLTEETPELKQLIQAQGLAGKVFIAGFQENPYPWIKAAELLVLSSDHEGLPNVLIEAIILHTKVVSTDCPSGPREILGNLASTCLAEPNNSERLASKINDAILAQFQSPNNFDSTFSADSVLNAYEALSQE